MDVDAVVEILKNNRALWMTATVTGGFAVIVSVLNSIGLYLQRKKQLDYDKKLENHKRILEKKNYVSKVRFDAEFKIYRELSQVFSEAIEGVHGIIPTDVAYYPVDEEQKKDFIEHLFIKFTKATNNAQKTLFANAPFIPKEIYNKFNVIMDLLRTQSEVYTEANLETTLSNAEGEIIDDDSNRTKVIDEKFAQLTEEIRTYLCNLEIIGG